MFVYVCEFVSQIPFSRIIVKIDLEELHFMALHSGFALWQLLPRLGPTEPPYFLE